jgi:hypothetical protein
MYNSILHFIENDIKEIENLVAAMLKGEKASKVVCCQWNRVLLLFE